jgi:hypothetical protein
MFNVFLGSVAGLFYSYRIIYYVFFDFKKGQKNAYKHINNNNYFSYYYSNTSLASNLSIVGLIVVSYVICFVMFLIFFKNFYMHSDVTGLLNVSNFFNLYQPYEGFLFNLSYLN